MNRQISVKADASRRKPAKWWVSFIIGCKPEGYPPKLLSVPACGN